MRHRRDKVVWKAATELPSGVVPGPTRRAFIYREREAEVPAWMTRELQPGDAFTLTDVVCPILVPPDMEPPPHAYLMRTWYHTGTGPIRSGEMAVHLGPLRIADRGGPTVHLRHTFLIAGGIYVVPDLGVLRPLEESSWTRE